MLCLSRKKLEEIVIGDEIVIQIIDVRGDKVRIGIDAPKHVSVHRREIYEVIKRELIVTSHHPNSTSEVQT